MNIFGQILSTAATSRARTNARAGVVTASDLASAEEMKKEEKSGAFLVVASLMGVVVAGATIAGAVMMTRENKAYRRRYNY